MSNVNNTNRSRKPNNQNNQEYYDDYYEGDEGYYDEGYGEEEQYDENYEEGGEDPEEEKDGACSQCQPKCVLLYMSKVLPFFMILIALGIMALGILGFVLATGDTFESIFVGIYLVLFGVLIILAELKWKDFLFLVPFLIMKRYRGIFVIFVGTICFAISLGPAQWPGFMAGGICVFFGLLYSLSTCLEVNEKELETQQAFEKSILEDDDEDENKPTVVLSEAEANANQNQTTGVSTAQPSQQGYAQNQDYK